MCEWQTAIPRCCYLVAKQLVLLLLLVTVELFIGLWNNELCACTYYDTGCRILFASKIGCFCLLLQNRPTPLVTACRNDHETVVELLLDAGSDVNKAMDVSFHYHGYLLKISVGALNMSIVNNNGVFGECLIMFTSRLTASSVIESYS